MDHLKRKIYKNLIISCDGGAASGKTTGAKLIAKKYNLKFLSSGMLYRYASYLILRKNQKTKSRFSKGVQENKFQQIE